MSNALHQNDGMKSKLIEITCQMIEQNNGSAHINMRAVARQAGCAHTNVYNYFASFNDLLYAAMFRVMEKIVQYTQKQVGTIAQTMDHFPAFIYAQIDFAFQFPGLFRFFWLDSLPGEPVPEEVKRFGLELKKRFAELVFNCSNGKLARDEAFEVSIILHSYLHGEICKLITGRDLDITREKIRNNVDRLLQILTRQ